MNADEVIGRLAGTKNFAEKLVDALEADRPRAQGGVEQSPAMGTALAPRSATRRRQR